MRNFIKAAALVSFLVPAISFADAPKADKAPAADAKPATDAKTDAKAPAAKKDMKAPAKKDAGAAKKDATPVATPSK